MNPQVPPGHIAFWSRYRGVGLVPGPAVVPPPPPPKLRRMVWVLAMVIGAVALWVAAVYLFGGPHA